MGRYLRRERGKGRTKERKEEQGRSGRELRAENRGLSLEMWTRLGAAWPMRALAGGWQGWVSWDFQPGFQTRCAPRPSVDA